MTLWSRLKKLFGESESTPTPSDPFSEVRWIAASDNPFGVEILDCRGSSQSIVATTMNPSVGDSYLAMRGSNGEEYRTRVPEDSACCECELRYAHKGASRDGPIFKAETMDDKWDIYLYDGYLYFARSWTGELVFRARIVLGDDGASVIAIDARRSVVESEPAYAVAAVDYLIRSHLYRLQVPHPLPKSIGRDPREGAIFSFSQYGRHGLFGSFADTTRLSAGTRKTP